MVSIVHAARDIGRLRDISKVLVRHGFGEVVYRLGLGRARSERGSGPPDELEPVATPEDEATGAKERSEISTAVRLRLVLQDLGPSFVKLGQMASTRRDLLPEEIIGELEKLQDSVPPCSFDQVRQQVEASLGRQLAAVYESFEPEPLAAASIAQVHAATLRTDSGVERVVVKVQRPGVATTIASDLDLLHALAALIERTIPETKAYSPTGLVRQLDRAIIDELDFVVEAEHAERFAQNFEGNPDVTFPRVFRESSAKHVITLERFDGPRLRDALAAGHSGPRLASIALEALFKQVFVDGFFHADPHPGNVMVLGSITQPRLGLLDLGMVGRLTPRMRDLTADVMICAARRDYDGIADAMLALGSSRTKVDRNAFRAEVAQLADRYLGRQLKDISTAKLIGDLVRAANRFGLEIPTDFILMGKALMTVEGIGRQLDPSLDVLEATRPFFFDLLRRRYAPERLGPELLRRAERLSEATAHLPEQLQEVLDDVRLGRLRLQWVDPSAGRRWDRLGRRLVTGLGVAALLLGGTHLWGAGHRLPALASAAVAALWLLASAAADAFRNRNEPS
jgi:ubiquinone biosynthesis protein